MQIPNKKNDLTQKYNRGIIMIHWFTLVLIISLFPLGKYMEGLPPIEKMGMIKIHIVLGVLVFVLTFIRSRLSSKSPSPNHIKTESKFNDKLVIWIHKIFYFLLRGISITGIITLFLGGYAKSLSLSNHKLILTESVTALTAHGILSNIMMILLILHIGGVIKHYIYTNENILKRII